MSFLLRYRELPRYLRLSYIFSFLLILCHVAVSGILVYWQAFEPENLAYKAWFKGPMHLELFDSTTTAAIIFGIFLTAQLIGLFLYITWMFEQGKKIYYLVFGMIVAGIWTYFLLPGIILLGLMLPEASLHHFGVLSFEDLF